MPVKELCMLCHKSIKKRQKHIKCHNCKEYIHAKCNKFNNSSLENSEDLNKNWHCLTCTIPFSKLTDVDFGITQSGEDFNSCSSSKLANCPQHLKNLFQKPKQC